MGGSQTAPAPKVMSEFAPILDQIQQTVGFGLGNAQRAAAQSDPFSMGFGMQHLMPALQGLQGLEQTMFGMGQRAAPGIFGQGLTGLQEQMETGFMPSILEGIQERLMPARNRQVDQGTADLMENAARMGLSSSTGTLGDLQNYTGAVDAGLMSNLANIEGNLAPLALQARQNAVGASLNFPSSLANQALQRLTGAVGIGQNMQDQAFRGLSAAGPALQGIQTYQPTQVPGKTAQTLGGLAQLGGAAGSTMGGYGALKAGKG